MQVTNNAVNNLPKVTDTANAVPNDQTSKESSASNANDEITSSSTSVSFSEKALQLAQETITSGKAIGQYVADTMYNFYTGGLVAKLFNAEAKLKEQQQTLADLNQILLQKTKQVDEFKVQVEKRVGLIDQLNKNPENPQALHDMAVMLATGQGGPVDLPMATLYFKAAANIGHPSAIYYYSTMQGEGSEPDVNKAAAYCKYSADQGVMLAQHHYKMVVQFNDALEMGPQKALEHQKQLADDGDMVAQHIFATMRKVGEPWDQNLPQARQYFKLAADQGFPQSQTEYAQMLEKGTGGEVNIAESLTYYQKAADQGNLDALRQLIQLNKPLWTASSNPREEL